MPQRDRSSPAAQPIAVADRRTHLRALNARDLEVISHERVRGVKQSTHIWQTSCAQHHLADSLDLGHDVSGSRPNPTIRQPIQSLVAVGKATSRSEDMPRWRAACSQLPRRFAYSPMGRPSQFSHRSQASVGRPSGRRVARDVTVLAVDPSDDGVGRPGNDGTDDRCHPEEPQLSWRTVAVEERHAG